MTEKAGTGKPQARNTGEPLEPGRTQQRHPKAETDRAKAEASANEPNGTKRQAGAGDQPAPEGKARRAQTQPQDKGRATTPAPREEPTTETKPAINTPRIRKHTGRPRRPSEQQLKRKKEKKENAF